MTAPVEDEDRIQWRSQIADCTTRESLLSDWERGFIESVGTVVESGYTLTERQILKLDQIWTRVTDLQPHA